MKKFIIFALSAFLLAGCGPSRSTLPTGVAETEAVQPVETFTTVPTNRPTVMPSPTITLTQPPTVTPSPTEEQISIPEASSTPLPPLSDVLLNADELNNFMDIWKTTPSAINTIPEGCDYDCVDNLWTSKDSQTLLLVSLEQRAGGTEAENMVARLKIEYVVDQDYSLLDTPHYEGFSIPDNTWFAKDDGIYIIVASHYDIIVNLVVTEMEYANDVDAGARLEYYLYQQINKLKEMGY